MLKKRVRWLWQWLFCGMSSCVHRRWAAVRKTGRASVRRRGKAQIISNFRDCCHQSGCFGIQKSSLCLTVGTNPEAKNVPTLFIYFFLLPTGAGLPFITVWHGPLSSFRVIWYENEPSAQKERFRLGKLPPIWQGSEYCLGKNEEYYHLYQKMTHKMSQIPSVN